MGKAVAACTIDTTKGDGEWSVIIHPDVTLNIHVPTLEINVAVHSTTKMLCLKGAKAELVGAVAIINTQNTFRSLQIRCVGCDQTSEQIGCQERR